MRVILAVVVAGALIPAFSQVVPQEEDWPAYGRDPGGTRYSPLTQINTTNVTRLQRAWTYHTGEQGRSFETTPILVDNVLYFSTQNQNIVALVPETGKEIWKYNSKSNDREHRGVSYWPGDRQTQPRILFGTGDGRLIALDAKTGKPVSGFESWLAQHVTEEWRGRIIAHELVPNAELLSRIAEHDIGFAGETPLIRNKDLTVSNKILHYLLAGLAVVASETAGHREVAEQAPCAVFLYPSGDAAALAARLNSLLESADTLRQAKAAALDAAERRFCWERQEKALLESINRALGSPAR